MYSRLDALNQLRETFGMKQEARRNDADIEALRAEGVEYTFGVVGTTTNSIVTEMYGRSDIRFVDTRHEEGAAFMAYGYARASGKPTACITTSGPGTINLLTGIALAYKGRAPVMVIAGDVAGHPGPGDTYTPMTMVHATLSPGARFELPWRRDDNALVYVLAGFGTVGPERIAVRTGQLAVFGPGDTIAVEAAPSQESRSPELEVLVLGGRPIREPVAWLGPFVMNTRDEVVQAYEDYQAGRLGTVPAVHATPTEVVESSATTDEPGR